jgi:hypothetical protein
MHKAWFDGEANLVGSWGRFKPVKGQYGRPIEIPSWRSLVLRNFCFLQLSPIACRDNLRSPITLDVVVIFNIASSRENLP